MGVGRLPSAAGADSNTESIRKSAGSNGLCVGRNMRVTVFAGANRRGLGGHPHEPTHREAVSGNPAPSGGDAAMCASSLLPTTRRHMRQVRHPPYSQFVVQDWRCEVVDSGTVPGLGSPLFPVGGKVDR